LHFILFGYQQALSRRIALCETPFLFTPVFPSGSDWAHFGWANCAVIAGSSLGSAGFNATRFSITSKPADENIERPALAAGDSGDLAEVLDTGHTVLKSDEK